MLPILRTLFRRKKINSIISAYSIWNDATVPITPSIELPLAVELGVRLRTNVNGFIKAIRFYKSTLNTGVHIGNLWTNDGQNLGTVTFSDETAEGWQQANFATPIAVTAGTVYVASYHLTEGHYAGDSGYFITDLQNGPLQFLHSGLAGSNGAYIASASSVFPNVDAQNWNFWVDVVFSTENSQP